MFFSIQAHILKQKGGKGMGYIQAKKSGINIPSKCRRSIDRDVMSRCRLFLLAPAPCCDCTLLGPALQVACTLAGIKEINSKLHSRAFSTSFLFLALTLPSEAFTETWELKAKHSRLQLWVYLTIAFWPIQMVVRKGLIYSQERIVCRQGFARQ